MILPDRFLAYAGRSAAWAAWLDVLPRLVGGLVDEWVLVVDGPPTHGSAALVVPVRAGQGRTAVLKVGWPHPEAEHEHLALKRWAGNGAVEVLRADPARFALLLERLEPRDLSEEWDVAACEVVADLYSRLHVPALPQLRRLSAYVAEWTDALSALPPSAPIPHRLVQQGVSIGRTFATDPGTDGTLIHGDLHYENVLRHSGAADREPWLAIDPKPMSGDPHYELAPMLWNRFDELAGDVRRGTRARFHAVVDAAGLDEDRARDWVVFRMLVLAADRLADPPGVRRETSDHDLLTMCVAIAKAVQG